MIPPRCGPMRRLSTRYKNKRRKERPCFRAAPRAVRTGQKRGRGHTLSRPAFYMRPTAVSPAGAPTPRSSAGRRRPPCGSSCRATWFRATTRRQSITSNNAGFSPEEAVMDHLTEKFSRLGIDSAPGQESRRKEAEPPLQGAPLSGVPVDFSHGDVDAFPPAPGALQAFEEGVRAGGRRPTRNTGGRTPCAGTWRKSFPASPALPSTRRRSSS